MMIWIYSHHDLCMKCEIKLMFSNAFFIALGQYTVGLTDLKSLNQRCAGLDVFVDNFTS